VEPGRDSLVFVSPKGGRLRRSNFNILWAKVRDTVGLSGGEAIATAIGEVFTTAKQKGTTKGRSNAPMKLLGFSNPMTIICTGPYFAASCLARARPRRSGLARPRRRTRRSTR
jgi:hypothetical protein